MTQSSVINSKTNRARGYVLVLALLLIAMSGSVLTIMAKRSIFDASDVQETQQQLQHRWAAYSLEKSLLPQASKVMEALQEENSPDAPAETVNRFDFEIQLADMSYQLTLADENAKANINTLLSKKNAQTPSSQAIQSLLDDLQVRNIPTIKLKPYTWESTKNQQAIQTLGQVFENYEPQELYPYDSQEPSVLDALTCWGDGKLNLHTASPEVIKAVCLKHMTRGEIDKLIIARQATPDISLSKALTLAGIDKKKLTDVKKMFTEQTTCHSLWTRWQTDRRLRHRLSIAVVQSNTKTTSKTPPNQSENAKLDSLIFEW